MIFIALKLYLCGVLVVFWYRHLTPVMPLRQDTGTVLCRVFFSGKAETSSGQTLCILGCTELPNKSPLIFSLELQRASEAPHLAGM